MHFLRCFVFATKAGLFVLLHEFLMQQANAQEMLQVVKRFGGQYKSASAAVDQISRPVTAQHRHSTQSPRNYNSPSSQRKKSSKSCKCDCVYTSEHAGTHQQCQKTTRSSLASVVDRAAVDPPLEVNGIFPSLAVTASSGPNRTECGIGALMPWADKLYMVTYLAGPGQGNGTGLYAIDENFVVRIYVLLCCLCF